MLRVSLIITAVYAMPLFGNQGFSEEIQQWQYEEDREITGPIDPTRCVRAVYGEEILAEEPGPRIEWWHPPVPIEVINWLEYERGHDRLTLSTCDESAS